MPHRTGRRGFLRGAAAAGLAAGCRAAAGPFPDRTPPAHVIDTHTHFYDPSRPQGVPWPPKEDALLYRAVLPRDYRALEMPRPADAAVVVEASPWVEDNQWILDLARDDPFLIGLVGNLPVGTEEFPALLERFAANPLFLGMRIHEWEWKAKLGPAASRAHLGRLARLGLALDLNPAPPRLPEAARLIREVPGLRVVLNHVANLRIDGNDPPEAWRKGIAEVAGAGPDVYCKVSGLVEGSGKKDGQAPRALDFYRRVLDAVWEAFGDDRVIYGSNWPVCARAAPAWVTEQLILDYAAARGPEALEKVFWKNAMAAYRCRFRAGGPVGRKPGGLDRGVSRIRPATGGALFDCLH